MGCSSPQYIEPSISTCKLAIHNLNDELLKVYSLKGKNLLAVSINSLKVLDTTTEKELVTSHFERELFCTILISDPDYKLIQGTVEGPITIRDMETKKTFDLLGHRNTVTFLLLLKNGYLLSCSGDGLLIIWNLETQDKILELFVHKSTIWNCCELKNEKIITTADGGISKIFNFQTKSKKKMCELQFSTPNCTNLIQLLDGRILYNNKGQLIIYQLERLLDISEKFDKIKEHEFHKPDKVIDAHEQDITYIFEKKNGEIYTGDQEGIIKIWNFKYEFECIFELIGHKGRINYISEYLNDMVVSCSADKSIRIWGKGTSIYPKDYV